MSMTTVLTGLEEMRASEIDLRNQVIVVDTLKKLGSLLSKDAVRELFTLLRALTQRGMTVVLLAHTNKYRSADNQSVFEGVGDVKSDSDDLIFSRR